MAITTEHTVRSEGMLLITSVKSLLLSPIQAPQLKQKGGRKRGREGGRERGKGGRKGDWEYGESKGGREGGREG